MAGTFGSFASVDDFLGQVTGDNPSNFDTLVTNAQARFETGNWSLAEVNVGQLAFYAQDEVAVTDDLSVTLGLRIDKALYFNTEDKAQEFIDNFADGCCYFPFIEYYDEDGEAISFDHTKLPESKWLFSPRLGFNWDITGDQTNQLRGGTGVFTGRFPFVWIGNQIGNPNSFFYQVTHPDFQWPQVWRSNLGLDKKFNGGWSLTTDLIFTKDINAMMVRNYGINKPDNGVSAPCY